MLLYAALSAHAMPYVLDLELTGPPDHVYWPDSGHITESWNVPVIGPPLGTDAFDVSIGLDAVYTALVPSSSEALQFKFGCDWGGSGGGTGTQVIEIGEYLIFQPPIFLNGF